MKSFLRHHGPTILLLALLSYQSRAQESHLSIPADTSHDFWSRYNISKVATAGLVGGILVYGWGVWWKNDYRSFHLDTYPQGFFDLHLGVDKVGHLYTGYYIFHATDEILRWGGHDENEAFWWATGIAAFHGFVTELGDGFSQYGFDYRDMLSNWAGAGFSILQRKIPAFRNFEIKWSLYYPLQRHSFKVNDLYDYHIYWLSARVNELLPKDIEPLWPDWLQIAVGYSSADEVTRREFIVGFDYNLERIPIDGTDWGLIKRLLNLFHLPAPGVKFSPGRKPEFQLLLLN